ncbi:MAG: hypothetical protein ABR915_20940 [Thermoguttaceae bacterium]
MKSVGSERWGTRGAPAQFPCWTAWLAERLREMGSPYAAFYHSGLETQIMPVKDDDLLDDYGRAWPVISDGPRPVRTVVTDKRGKPIRSNDGVVDFHPALIRVAGTSWWNWRAGRTEACYFDFDFGHGGKALDEAGIARVDEWAQRLPCVLSATSKGSRGRHWLVRLADPLPAPTRGDHSFNCRRIKAKVSADLGLDIGKYVCSFGVMQYIWANQVEGRQ